MKHVERTIDILRATKEEFARAPVGDLGAIMTSSFQSQSAPLLHLVSIHWPGLPIYFIDTGFHFAQTIHYRDKLTQMLDLNLFTIQSPSDEVRRSFNEERWRFDSNGCCDALKVEVMEAILKSASVTCWITGVRRDQTKARRVMQERGEGPYGVVRVHPVAHWTGNDMALYRAKHDLPLHPLDAKGYDSIGCWPCSSPGYLRTGRWPGEEKEGCGIHRLTHRPPCQE